MPALMDRDGTETAFAIAPSVGRQGKLDGVERGHAALFLVEGMHVPGIGQLVNPVEGIAGGSWGGLWTRYRVSCRWQSLLAVSGSAFS